MGAWPMFDDRAPASPGAYDPDRFYLPPVPEQEPQQQPDFYDPDKYYSNVPREISLAPERAPQQQPQPAREQHPPLIRKYGPRWEWDDLDKDFIRFDSKPPPARYARLSRDQQLTFSTTSRRHQDTLHCVPEARRQAPVPARPERRPACCAASCPGPKTQAAVGGIHWSGYVRLLGLPLEPWLDS